MLKECERGSKKCSGVCHFSVCFPVRTENNQSSLRRHSILSLQLPSSHFSSKISLQTPPFYSPHSDLLLRSVQPWLHSRPFPSELPPSPIAPPMSPIIQTLGSFSSSILIIIFFILSFSDFDLLLMY